MGCIQSKSAKTAPNHKPTNQRATQDSSKICDQGYVEDNYNITEEIGRKGIRNGSGEVFAIKSIEKKFVVDRHLDQLQREIEIMKRIDHPNVLKLVEIYETKETLTLVLEMISGGELFYKIMESGSYSERDAASIVKQIVLGVDYLHKMGIAHRDLKPENLLVSENEKVVKPFRVVIADFGLSKAFHNGERLETSCGTPDYVAPEVITCESYTNAVDMWAIGVITYIILCGFPPFYSKVQNDLFEQILKAQVHFPSPEWDSVSEDAKGFILGLIVKDPVKRMTAADCLKHSWLMKLTSVNSLTQSLNVDRIKNYNDSRRLLNNYKVDVEDDRTSSGEINPLKAAREERERVKNMQ